MISCDSLNHINFLSLTDSMGLSFQGYYNSHGGEFKFGEQANDVQKSIFGYNYIDDWLLLDSSFFKKRIFKENSPFNGIAKICVNVEDKFNERVVLEIISVKNGFLDGKYISFNKDFREPTGDTLWVGYFKNGFKHGEWKVYDNEFHEQRGGNYYMGVKVGYWKEKNSYEGEGLYINGIKNGTWKEIAFSGNYLNGKKEGIWIKKDVSGNVICQEIYLKGKKINSAGDCK